MNDKGYKFNVEAFYCIIAILKRAEIDLKAVYENKLKGFNNVIDAIHNGKEDTIKLVSICTGFQVQKIREMSAYDYVDEVDNILESIDWMKLLGKLITKIETLENQETDVQEHGKQTQELSENNS